MPRMIDRLANFILDTLPRATFEPDELPKLAPNAVVTIDATGRLNILLESGLLVIDEEDLNVIDADWRFS